ncbi:crotonobetainyl-CoA:carnitine CoA-transferase CaiB-like acyl-CoA transferase [Bradyrhizobium sp. i1.4.4]
MQDHPFGENSPTSLSHYPTQRPALRTCRNEDRHIRLVGQPVTLSRTPSKMVARPPEFGEQTDEILKEFGLSADEIATLRNAKVV